MFRLPCMRMWQLYQFELRGLKRKGVDNSLEIAFSATAVINVRMNQFSVFRSPTFN